MECKSLYKVSVALLIMSDSGAVRRVPSDGLTDKSKRVCGLMLLELLLLLVLLLIAEEVDIVAAFLMIMEEEDGFESEVVGVVDDDLIVAIVPLSLSFFL